MKPKLRCAVYTRKSSEEGLEQGFNSLHAQREACEAYVLSQAGEGWAALKTHYDDGGFSGGSMDRPGLTALLADIASGKIDVVVVYKVDRLTRSLMDFARIVEAFDRAGVSFVSVTQAFNTTTSMGRLTLNVLLSFAQFEREVTGERIRDKLAASKQKGMWMGGVPPLGYDPPTDLLTRALVVNEAEAQTVRLLFDRYLELGSVRALQAWLQQEGLHSKAWITKKGQPLGGMPFNRGALFYLLKNCIYIGRIPHKDRSYPGAHPGIVDPEIFAAVAARLAARDHRSGAKPARVGAMMLKGLIFDAAGDRMHPTYSHGKSDRLYRYYVSSRTPDLEGVAEDHITRVKADLIEALVAASIKALARGAQIDVAAGVVRVEVQPTTVQIVLRRSSFFKHPSDAESELALLQRRLGENERLLAEPDPALVRLVLPRRLKLHGGKTVVVDQTGRRPDTASHPDQVLMRGLRSAHRQVARCAAVPIGRLDHVALPAAPPSPYVRNLCRIAFLAPDIQQMIVEGRQPLELTLTRLLGAELPASWVEQRRLFGIAS